MALALCLLFDSRSDRLVREMWSRLEARGVRTLETHTHGRHHPHLSYAVLLDGDVEAVRGAVAELPDGGPVELTVQGSIVFPRGRAALACSVSSHVAARQEQVVDALERTGAVLHRHYLPGHWVPHVSLATRATGDALAVVVNEVSDVLPLTVRAEQCALIDTSTGRLWPVSGVP
jgi:2'-5' RNA ligase